jgi:hypothetical protein
MVGRAVSGRQETQASFSDKSLEASFYIQTRGQFVTDTTRTGLPSD